MLAILHLGPLKLSSPSSNQTFALLFESPIFGLTLFLLSTLHHIIPNAATFVDGVDLQTHTSVYDKLTKDALLEMRMYLDYASMVSWSQVVATCGFSLATATLTEY